MPPVGLCRPYAGASASGTKLTANSPPAPELRALMWVNALNINGAFSVSDQQHKQEIANMERVNAELTDSLQRCRFLLVECRSKLAANSNEEQLIEDSEKTNFGLRIGR